MKQICCTKNEGGPFGVGVQALIPNYLLRSHLRGVGVSRQEKRHFMLQVRAMETSKAKSLFKRREVIIDVKTRHSALVWDKSESNLITDSDGVRRIGGVNVAQVLVWNLGTSHPNVKSKAQAVDTVESERLNVGYWDRMICSSDDVCENKLSEGIMQFSFIHWSTVQTGGICG